MASKLKMKKSKKGPSDENNKLEMDQDKCKSALKLWNNIDRNSRNLCFVNAALQQLHHIEEFKKYFQNCDGNKFDSKIAPVCIEIC